MKREDVFNKTKNKATESANAEKTEKLLMAHKIFILHNSVMRNDHRCLENFGNNCIVIPVVELQEVRRRANDNNVDYGAWKFIQNLAEYEKYASGRIFQTKSGSFVILDSNGNNFEDLSFGMEKSSENRIYLIAWNIIKLLCEASKKQKGRNLTDDELERIRKKVIIVSSETISRMLGRHENLETQIYKSGNFISDINDLYTGLIDLKIAASSKGIFEMIAEGGEKGKETKTISGERLAEYVNIDKLYPNQCCILSFEDDIRYAIYKKGQGFFRIIEQRPSIEKGKIGAKNMEHCFFEALARDKTIALITVAGGAGTGKTVMVAKASLEMLERRENMSVIVYRPIVDQGEKLGFFPGNYDEKISGYLSPVVSAFRYVANNGKHNSPEPPKDTHEYEMFLKNGKDDNVNRYRASGRLRLESINFIQGTTNHDAWMVVDESQDFIQSETEALLTRIGDNGKILMTGDLKQIHREFLRPTASGLAWIIESMKQSELAAHITFTEVFRHPLVEEISNLNK